MQITWAHYGFAGYPAVDPSGRAPIESISGDPSGYSPGVPVGFYRHFSITPLTLQADNVAASQTPAGASSLTLAAGTGVTSKTITVNGVDKSVLDITGAAFSRTLRVVGQAGVSQVNYTVKGYDEYNQLTTSTFAGPNGAQTIETTKAWRYIESITVDGGTSAAITVGTGDSFGFPIAVFRYDQIISMYWNSLLITASTGFTAADTATPTASTGHVRGLYQVQTSASDGTRQFNAYIHESWANANNMNLAYGKVPA